MPSAGMESLKEVTLRPWPVQKKEELSLEDLHVKVEQLTTERGHLRDITEASLQEAIAAGKDVPDGVSGSAGPKQPSKEAPTQQEMREQIMKAGSEMHSHVEYEQSPSTPHPSMRLTDSQMGKICGYECARSHLSCPLEPETRSEPRILQSLFSRTRIKSGYTLWLFCNEQGEP